MLSVIYANNVCNELPSNFAIYDYTAMVGSERKFNCSTFSNGRSYSTLPWFEQVK